MKPKPKKQNKIDTVTISKADLSWSIDACSPSVLDHIGNALFQKLWKKLQSAQGRCRFDRGVVVHEK